LFNFPICDAHHHLWDLNAVCYPWLNAPLGTPRFFGNPAPIQKNYLTADLQADIGALPVIESVHVEVGAAAGQHLAETAWVQRQIEASRNADRQLPAAMVAYADLEADDLSQVLDRIQSYAGVRGIRQILGRSPGEDQQTGSHLLLDSPHWQRGLSALATRGLSFDLQLIPAQMERAYPVFKRFEQLQVVLCHCGSPWFLNEQYRHSQTEQMWLTGLRKLASLPNVHCKISGLSMFGQKWQPNRSADIIYQVLDVFGVERCMLGSNFPVDKLYIDYQTLWGMYNQLIMRFSAAERRGLLGENCRRFYRLKA